MPWDVWPTSSLTGSLVFEADNSMQMLMQHLHTEPTRPSERSELPIPRELDDLILACLQKDPARRPQNAGELLNLAYGCRCTDGWGQDEARQLVAGPSAKSHRVADGRHTKR